MNLKNLVFKPSVALFGMPMGLIGLGLNGVHYAETLQWQTSLPLWILFYGYLALLIVGVPYFIKLFQERFKQHSTNHLTKEWQSNFQISLFPSITLTLMLGCLSLWHFNWYRDWAFWGFLTVMIAHTILWFAMVSRWLFDVRIELEDLKPTWFILLSGNFVVVIAGMQMLPESWREVLWFYFSATFFIWGTLVFSLFYRLFFVSHISLRMRPTLFIFMAPPSLGTIASILLLQQATVPLSSWWFYGFATMMLLVWLYSIAEFRKSELSMVSWSYVYPLAAYGLAGQYMGDLLQQPLFWWWSGVIFILLLGFVTLLTGWLVKQAWLAVKSSPEAL